jgi:hypothetical protein
LLYPEFQVLYDGVHLAEPQIQLRWHDVQIVPKEEDMEPPKLPSHFGIQKFDKRDEKHVDWLKFAQSRQTHLDIFVPYKTKVVGRKKEKDGIASATINLTTWSNEFRALITKTQQKHYGAPKQKKRRVCY